LEFSFGGNHKPLVGQGLRRRLGEVVLRPREPSSFYDLDAAIGKLVDRDALVPVGPVAVLGPWLPAQVDLKLALALLERGLLELEDRQDVLPFAGVLV